jgi:hypothetical protein
MSSKNKAFNLAIFVLSFVKQGEESRRKRESGERDWMEHVVYITERVALLGATCKLGNVRGDEESFQIKLSGEFQK